MGSKPGPGHSGVHFAILGTLHVAVDGREVALSSPKQRRLLGALLTDVGSVVSTDRLGEIVWGEDQPEDMPGAVQTHIHRLRSVLVRQGGEHARQVLATRAQGYALMVDPDQVDAGRFERLVEEARAAATPQRTASLLDAALRLWRGRPLAEFDDERARAEAVRLEELRNIARELRAEALLELGRDDEVIAELEPAVARHPFRERLRGQLMVALDRSGRRADALAAYRDLRDQLVRELGIEPSMPLRRLERAILQQAEELPWPAPAREVGSAGNRQRTSVLRSGSAGTVLAEPPTSFVGREEDVRGVTTALAHNRIVVLTGTGGVGKSRLALRVARSVADAYADGAVLCDLAGTGDPQAVTEVAATALGVLPAHDAEVDDALVALLRGQHLLFVLDNCEHVVTGAAALVDLIVRRCPDVDVLATSRQPLDVAGQQVWPVSPLEVADGAAGAAVALFCDRAAAVLPSFQLAGDDLDTVGELCRRLDGLPLAIELAAARVRSMTLADIADRLDERLLSSVGGSRATAPRHRSMQAVVDWSYALLPDGIQRLFDRLSVFAGGFGLDAVEQVCTGHGVSADAVNDGIGALVDHSLLTVERSGRHARYRLLETLRAYGAARLEERGEQSRWRRRHATFFASLADAAVTGLQGPEEARWVDIVDREFADLRSAHAWARAAGQTDLALRIPAGLCIYAYHRLRDEVFRWAVRALRMPDARCAPAAAAADVAAGVGYMQRGELDRAAEVGGRVLAAASDDEVLLRALQLLTEVALYQGRLQDTDRGGRELVSRARASASAYYESLGHLYRVHAAAYAGRGDDALARLDEGWQAVHSAGTPSLRAGYCFLEGEIRLDVQPEAARAAFQQAITIARSVGNRFVEGVARVAAASLETRHGEPDDALTAFREIVDHWRTSGDWAHMWTTLRNLLTLFERVGAHGPAAVLLGAVETASTGAPAFGADAARLATATHRLRASLGTEAFAAARTRGRTMSDDEAVLYALDEIDRLLAA